MTSFTDIFSNAAQTILTAMHLSSVEPNLEVLEQVRPETREILKEIMAGQYDPATVMDSSCELAEEVSSAIPHAIAVTSRLSDISVVAPLSESIELGEYIVALKHPEMSAEYGGKSLFDNGFTIDQWENMPTEMKEYEADRTTAILNSARNNGYSDLLTGSSGYENVQLVQAGALDQQNIFKEAALSKSTLIETAHDVRQDRQIACLTK